MPEIAVQITGGDTPPTSVTLTAVTSSVDGSTPAGLSLPIVWGPTGGSVSFVGSAPTYAYSYVLAYAAGSPVTCTGSVAGNGAAQATGQIITQASLTQFLAEGPLAILAQQMGPADVIDVPTVQAAIVAAEGRVFGALGTIRARLGSNPPTPFFQFPLTVANVPLLQAAYSIALPILQATAHRYAARWLNSRRSVTSVAGMAQSDNPDDVSRGMSMVASAWDKSATAELARIVKWAQGYSIDGTYVDLDLSPGAVIGAPYQGVGAPVFAGATVQPDGRPIVRNWLWREGFGWGWWGAW